MERLFTLPRTLADVSEELGGVPLARIVAEPQPGNAVAQDVIRFYRQFDKRLFELVYGTIIEKAYGFLDSALTTQIICELGREIDAKEEGFLCGPSLHIQMKNGNVRSPSITYSFWSDVHDEVEMELDISPIIPCLAIEVVKPDNTPREIEIKVRDLLESGVRQVWVIDRHQQNAVIHHCDSSSRVLQIDDCIVGGELIPNFQLPLKKLFESILHPKSRGKSPSP